MEFRVLGPLEVWEGGRLLTLGSAKQRTLLAVLLIHANHVVSTDQLINELWGERPPSTASNLLQCHVSQLRKALERAPSAPAPESLLVTRPPGYLLRVEPDQVDLYRFERLVGEAGQALAKQDCERAAERLHTALALWRGPALAGIHSESLRQIEAARLQERYLTATEQRIEADLLLGRHAHLVAELQALVASYPLRERLHGQLMLALYRSGRRAEALQAYREARRVLIEGLGLDPGQPLQQLQRAILAADPALGLRDAGMPGGWQEPVPSARPCQLPPDIGDLTGRDALVAELQQVVAREEGRQVTALVVSVIAGKAGVGKTALAVRVAHELRPFFPDGQLYVNLRGAEAQPLDPADVLASFLQALGVDGAALPDGLEGRLLLYRARLADRRLLVLLDNAASTAQVRPLLPGSASCAALVTSRRQLTGLEAARAVELEVLEPGRAVELLGKVAGAQRVAAEPEAALAIARLCGCLPLALRIAGARLASKRHWRLARLAERLDGERRLDELTAGDLDVRASVALSYQALPEDERRAFRLLGLLEAPDFAAWTAAALLDVSPAHAEDVLERLVDAQLLEVAEEDAVGQTRYRFHDLLQVFARERLLDEEAVIVRTAALKHALGVYLAAAQQAEVLLNPDRAGTVGRQAPTPAGRQQPTGGDGDAMVRGEPLRWFSAEGVGLAAAVEQAHRNGLWVLAWRLAAALAAFFEVRSAWDDWQRTHALALDAARRAADRRGEATILRSLGDLHREQGRFAAATACLEQSLAIFRALGDRRAEAYALHTLASVHENQAHFDAAAACLQRCLLVFRELGDHRGEGAALHHLGDIRRDQGRLDDAVACFERCLPVVRELGDHRREAAILYSFGCVRQRQSRPDEAVACFEQARTLFHELGFSLWEARSLRSLDETLVAAGGRHAVACTSHPSQQGDALPITEPRPAVGRTDH